MADDSDSDAESDFYGPQEVTSDLEARVLDLDPRSWWSNTQKRPGAPLNPLRLQQQGPGQPAMSPSSPPSAVHLHNPYAGVPYAWQLTESVDDFLARLPPSTTDQTDGRPWIFICNPYIARKRPKALSQNQNVRGGEDEAPEDEGMQLALFVQGGMERLHLASMFMEDCRKSGKSQAFVTRECKKAGADAADEILQLAHAAHVRCGKWMLFRDTNSIDETWATVARATANNELGIAAKVAPRPPPARSGSDRLICVYTADFRDAKDLRRVAEQLRRLGLVGNGRPLYYKPDAYTYLGIASGNPWQIRASIYDTTTILGK